MPNQSYCRIIVLLLLGVSSQLVVNDCCDWTLSIPFLFIITLPPVALAAKTKAHIHHVCFLRSLLGVKKATETICLLRETGQMPLNLYWYALGNMQQASLALCAR